MASADTAISLLITMLGDLFLDIRDEIFLLDTTRGTVSAVSPSQEKQQEKLIGHPVTPGAGVRLVGMMLVGGSMPEPTITNPVPARMARVVAGEGPFTTLGAPGAADVFVTAAEDIAGMTAQQLAPRLGIPSSKVFTVIAFSTPTTGAASPVIRNNPGFVGVAKLQAPRASLLYRMARSQLTRPLG
jgi:hypothetical protein